MQLVAFGRRALMRFRAPDTRLSDLQQGHLLTSHRFIKKQAIGTASNGTRMMARTYSVMARTKFASALGLSSSSCLSTASPSTLARVSDIAAKKGLLSRAASRETSAMPHVVSAQFRALSSDAGTPGGPVEPLFVPVMGESITEGTIVGFLKSEGDILEEDDIVVQIETDKITVDVRSPKKGVLKAVLASDGDVVQVGQQIATIDFSADAHVKRTEQSHIKTPAAATASPGDLTNTPPPQQTPVAQPSTTQKPPQPKPEPVEISSVRNMSEAGERRVAMTRMRRRIAERLKEAQNTAAMLTTFNEVDMSALMDLRAEYKDAFEKKHGCKLGFMSAFVKASTVALLEQPEVNAFIDGPDIVYRDYVDISVAVSTPKGLVVPAIRGCENMNFASIEKTIVALGDRARKGELTIEEMQGGTFTISNGGVFGSLLSTPIINMPQSAILGMHIIQKRPVAIKEQVVIRPMMYVALSYDHRLIDGREAVTFLRRIKTLIEDPRRLLLEIDI